MKAKEFDDCRDLSPGDRATLVEGLTALLRDRSAAYTIAAGVAAARGREAPDVGDFGISDILRLKRMFEPVEREVSTLPDKA